jgi:hypothetical protein
VGDRARRATIPTEAKYSGLQTTPLSGQRKSPPEQARERVVAAVHDVRARHRQAGGAPQQPREAGECGDESERIARHQSFDHDPTPGTLAILRDDYGIGLDQEHADVADDLLAKYVSHRLVADVSSAGSCEQNVVPTLPAAEERTVHGCIQRDCSNPLRRGHH